MGLRYCLLLLLLAPLYSATPQIIKDIKNEKYNFTSELSSYDAFTGSVIEISNNIKKLKYNIAGKPLLMTLPEDFKGCFATNRSNFVITETDKYGNAVEKIETGSREDSIIISVFFINPRTGYTEHAEHLPANIISRPRFYLTTGLPLVLLLLLVVFVLKKVLGKDKDLLSLHSQHFFPWLLFLRSDRPDLGSWLYLPLLSLITTAACALSGDFLPALVILLLLPFARRLNLCRETFLSQLLIMFYVISIYFFSRYGELFLTTDVLRMKGILLYLLPAFFILPSPVLLPPLLFFAWRFSVLPPRTMLASVGIILLINIINYFIYWALKIRNTGK